MNKELNRKAQRIAYLLAATMFFCGSYACIDAAYKQQEGTSDIRVAINELKANNVQVEESLATAERLQQDLDERDQNTTIGMIAGVGCALAGFGTLVKFDSLKEKKKDYPVDEIEF